MHDGLINQQVFIEDYFSLGPAKNLDDLLKKYYSGLSLTSWIDFDSVDLGGAYLAQIPTEICSIDFLENTVMTRAKFLIEKILDEVAQKNTDLNFDSICISRGRLKIVPILKKEKFLIGELSSNEEFIDWFKELLCKKGIKSSNGIIVLDGSCNSGLIQLDYAYKRILTKTESRILIISFDLHSDYRIKHFNNLGVACRIKKENFPKVLAKDRNGFGYSESLNAVIVSNISSAIKVLSVQHVSDASKIESPDIEKLNLALAIKKALAQANLTTEDIDLIKVHGSGTQVNDFYEYKCLENVFDARLVGIPIVAFKSFLGHSFNSANLIELIILINVINNQHLPVVLNSTPSDVSIKYSPTSVEYKRNFTNILFLSVGMGGINSACIISKENK